MRISPAFVLGIIVPIVIIFVGSDYAYHSFVPPANMADVMYFYVVKGNIYEMYMKTGYGVTSIEEYYRSAYYPYNEEYRGISSNAYSISYAGIVDGRESYELLKNHHKFRSGSHEVIPKDMQTKLILRYYVSGADNIYPLVKRQRRSITDEYNKVVKFRGITRRKIKPIIYTQKSALPLLPFSLPRSSSELKLYKQWLCKVAGKDELTDAWGNEVSLTIKDSVLSATSAGADHIRGTKDDIIMQNHLHDHPKTVNKDTGIIPQHDAQ